MIYFVECDLIPHIKIGYTNDRMDGRLREIGGSLPVRLSVIATFPGTQRQERECHKALDGHGRGGEWFARKPALAFLEDFRSKGPAQAIEEWAARAAEEKRLLAERVAAATAAIRAKTGSVIERAIAQYGIQTVCDVMQCHATAVSHWRAGKVPELHRMLNLLTLDVELLDPLFAIVGMRSEPLIPRLTAIVHEAEGLKAA